MDNFIREPLCLQQSILGVPVCMKPSLTYVLRRPDTHGSYGCACRIKPASLVIFFCRLGIGELEHLCMHALTECLNKGEKAVPPDVALERRTKRVIPGFRPVRSLLDAVGPSLLSATDLASRYGIEGEICRPLNHMRQIPRLLTAPDRPCHYNLGNILIAYIFKRKVILSVIW